MRNPFDTLVSYFNLFATRKHTETIAPEVFETFAHVWQHVIEESSASMAKCHQFWQEQAKTIPVYFVRYEDLLLKREETLRKMFCFLLNVTDIEGTLIEALIKRAVDEGPKQIYKPRMGKIDSNRDRYSPEQIKFIEKTMKPFLVSCGYADGQPGEYFSEIDEHNKKTMEWLASEDYHREVLA